MYSNIVSNTRNQLGVNLRDFGDLVGRSHALVGRWELGQTPPRYEDMFYLYTHTDNALLRQMAGELMRELDEARWSVDRNITAVVSPLEKGDTNIITTI